MGLDLIFEVVPRVSGITITVDDSGGADYMTIQEGVDAANPDDTVFIYNGIYHENVIIDKSIQLIGENRESTIVDGGSPGIIFYINADSVEIENINITSNGNTGRIGGILLDSNYNTIINNNIMYLDGFGIGLSQSSYNPILGNKIISGGGAGIDLISSSHNSITSNIIIDNTYGIHLDDSSHNLIRENTFSGMTQIGVELWSSTENDIIDNVFQNNNNIGYSAIELYSSNKNNITENNITNHTHWGIYLSSSSNNNLINNDLRMNHLRGIELDSSTYNNILGNNVHNSRYCIRLDASFNNNITSNNVSNTDGGIILGSSSNNNVNNNIVSLSEEYGILLSSSIENSLMNNILTESGIGISGNSLSHWNTHNIDTSNTVNGKDVFYWKNSTGGVIPTGAGEVILANCSNVIIEDQNFMNGSIGIELGFSSNNTLKNNSISNEYYGTLFYSSKNNILFNCSIKNSFNRDFHLGGNSHTTVINTTFNEGKVYFEDSISTLTVKWFLNVNVSNILMQPIPGAVVCIKDIRNTLPPQKYITDSDGQVNWLIETEYVKRKYSTVYYTPHKITAWNETLLGFAEVNMNESREINVVLDTPSFEIPLKKGWNLISLPLVQSDTSITSVLSSIAGNYDKVMWFNTSEGKWHSTDDDLTDLDHTMGFWIHMKTDDILIVNGDIPNSTSVQLYNGWNLVGNPSFCNHEIDEIFGSIVGNYTAIQWYDASDKSDHWKHYNDNKPPNLNDLTYITNCRGYWVYAKEDCVWDVDNF